MAVMALNKLSAAGTRPPLVAAGASDTVNYGNGHNTFVVFRNQAAPVITVTVVRSASVLDDGTTHPDKTYTLADGSVTPTEVWIPIKSSYDDGTGLSTATITTSAQSASVLRAAVVVDF